MDPISRLRRRIPNYESLLPPNHEYAELSKERETLNDFYSTLGPDFEERLLTLSKGQAIKTDEEEDQSQQKKGVITTEVPLEMDKGVELIPYSTSKSFTVFIQMNPSELAEVTESYLSDNHFQKVYSQLQKERDSDTPKERSQYPQYSLDQTGLFNFENWINFLRWC